MGKNVNSMPQSPHSITPEKKGGKPHGSPLALTVHYCVPRFQNLQAKFCFSKVPFLGKITANHADFAHFAHSPRELCEIHYKIHPP